MSEYQTIAADFIAGTRVKNVAKTKDGRRRLYEDVTNDGQRALYSFGRHFPALIASVDDRFLLNAGTYCPTDRERLTTGWAVNSKSRGKPSRVTARQLQEITSALHAAGLEATGDTVERDGYAFAVFASGGTQAA